MNFISTFDELNKLYEEMPAAKKEDEKLEDAAEEAYIKEELTETAEDEDIEIVDDEEISTEEISEEEPVAEEETKQVILECDKCGALVIKDEADIVVDEETDLVNVEDECQFCEEAKGFKIVGVVAPYETAEEAVEEVPEEATEEHAEDEEIFEESVEPAVEDEEDIIDEDLADVFRKTFDKPASIKTQQAWEDELNGEMGEISDERRAELEKKFAQQRDWEERHPDKEVK